MQATTLFQPYQSLAEVSTLPMEGPEELLTLEALCRFLEATVGTMVQEEVAAA
jgi:hypothetical protein